MAGFQLAQLNIAQMRSSYDDPAMADFVNNLDRVNDLWALWPDAMNKFSFRL